MSFELLIYSPSMGRVAAPIQRNLERMGIAMTIRQVDVTQYVNRMRNRDYDMIDRGYDANAYPSLDLKQIWRSDYIDSTYNTAGVQDPAVDYLIDGIAAHQADEKALLAWGRAFDRVLTWNFYVVPMWNLEQVPHRLLEQVRAALAHAQVRPRPRLLVDRQGQRSQASQEVTGRWRDTCSGDSS